MLIDALRALGHYFIFLASFTTTELRSGNFLKVFNFWTEILLWPNTVFLLSLFFSFEVAELLFQVSCLPDVEMGTVSRAPFWYTPATINLLLFQIPVWAFHLFYFYLAVVISCISINFLAVWLGF